MDSRFGRFIKHHRIASGFKSQRQLAERSGVSAATISRIESEVQKPNVETLKELAPYLKTTSLVELMVVCGYWENDDLLEEIDLNTSDKGNLARYISNTNENSSVNENEVDYFKENDFVKKIDLTDEELLKQFELTIDGRRLTEAEAKGIIAYIRSLRQM